MIILIMSFALPYELCMVNTLSTLVLRYNEVLKFFKPLWVISQILFYGCQDCHLEAGQCSMTLNIYSWTFWFWPSSD